VGAHREVRRVEVPGPRLEGSGPRRQELLLLVVLVVLVMVLVVLVVVVVLVLVVRGGEVPALHSGAHNNNNKKPKKTSDKSLIRSRIREDARGGLSIQIVIILFYELGVPLVLPVQKNTRDSLMICREERGEREGRETVRDREKNPGRQSTHVLSSSSTATLILRFPQRNKNLFPPARSLSASPLRAEPTVVRKHQEIINAAYKTSLQKTARSFLF